MNRLPPYNENEERSLLGAGLTDPVVVLDLCHREKVTPDYFHIPAHRMVYEAMLDYAAKHGAGSISSIALADHMPNIDRIGGQITLDNMVDSCLTVAHSEYHIANIKDAWLKRSVINAARLAEEICYEDNSGLEALAKAQAMFIDIDHIRRMTDPHEIAMKVVQQWENAENGVMSGIPTPWKHFDETTGGFPIGLSSALAATMGTGKSYIFSNMALYLGLSGIPGGYFCFEDGNVRTMARMASLYAKLSAYHLMIGRAGKMRIQLGKEAMPVIEGLPIGWHGERGMGTDDIFAAIARGKAKHGWTWAFFDGFKDIKRNYRTNKNDEDDRRSNALADMADKYEMAVVASHHITKVAGKEQQEDKPLILQDLKGSGGILDDCRFITFLQKQGDAYSLDCQKNNHGKIGHVDLIMPDTNVRLFIEAPRPDDEVKEPLVREVPLAENKQEDMPF